MSASVMTICLSFIIGIVATLFFISLPFFKKIFEKKVLLSVFAIVSSLILNTLLLTTFYWHPHDFVADVTPLKHILPLLCLPLLFVSHSTNHQSLPFLSLLLICTISVLGANLEISFFEGAPYGVNQLLTILLFYLYSAGFSAMAGIGTMPQIEGMTICSGLILLCLIGQAPQMLGAEASSLLGALVVSYYLNRTSPLGTTAAPILGFILGWMGLVAYQEFLGSCFIIFSMLYLIEGSVSMARKATFLPKYKNLAYNSLMIQALQEKIPVALLVRLIMTTCGLLITLGLFQVASSNQTSLPLFAAILVLWQSFRAINWQEENKPLKETNTEIFTQIKASLNNLLTLKKKKGKKNNKDKKA